MPSKKIDFNTLPDIGSEEFLYLSEEELNDVESAISHVEETTAIVAGQKITSRFECFVWDDEQADFCEGEVELVRYHLPREIHWKCKKCSDIGVVVNFEGTPWDLTGFSEKEAQEYLNKKYNAGYFFDLDFTDDINFVGSIEESAEDVIEWMNKLSDEEFENLRKVMDEEADRIGAHLDAFDGGLFAPNRDALLYSDWTDPVSPLYLRDDLPLEALNKSFFLHNARVFLKEISAQNGFGLTKTLQNLQRKHVESLMDKFIWPPEHMEKKRGLNKVFDEIDVWLLHSLRVLLDIAGLIRKQKGKFVQTKKYAHLMQEENAGKLYQFLFSAFFRKMNMAYMANGVPIPYQQESIPYILFRMQMMGSDWCSIEEVKENIFLKNARMEFHQMLRPYTSVEFNLYANILEPLELWGLIEVRRNGTSIFNYVPTEMRKTALFDQFLQFNRRL